jgi:hypothetical protein
MEIVILQHWMKRTRDIYYSFIAGKNSDNEWIRPVTNHRESGKIGTNLTRLYGNGNIPRKLDVVEIPLSEMVEARHHYITENWEIDANAGRWRFVKGYNGNLDDLLDNPERLWGHQTSSGYGENDRISPHYYQQFNNSLYFVKADCTLIIQNETVGNQTIKRIRCKFKYGNKYFSLIVKDNDIKKKYREINNETIPIGEKYLCVCLTPPFMGDFKSYLLVGSII